MATDILVPTLGESVSEATIGRWFKKPGDTVAAVSLWMVISKLRWVVPVLITEIGTLVTTSSSAAITVTLTASCRLTSPSTW